jgi:hypothetical protein
MKNRQPRSHAIVESSRDGTGPFGGKEEQRGRESQRPLPQNRDLAPPEGILERS